MPEPSGPVFADIYVDHHNRVDPPHYTVLFRGRGLGDDRAGGTFEGGQLLTELPVPSLSEAGPDVPYIPECALVVVGAEDEGANDVAAISAIRARSDVSSR